MSLARSRGFLQAPGSAQSQHWSRHPCGESRALLVSGWEFGSRTLCILQLIRNSDPQQPCSSFRLDEILWDFPSAPHRAHSRLSPGAQCVPRRLHAANSREQSQQQHSLPILTTLIGPFPAHCMATNPHPASCFLRSQPRAQGLQHHRAPGKDMEQRTVLLPSVAAEDTTAGKHFSPHCNVPIVLEIAYYEGVNF